VGWGRHLLGTQARGTAGLVHENVSRGRTPRPGYDRKRLFLSMADPEREGMSGLTGQQVGGQADEGGHQGEADPYRPL